MGTKTMETAIKKKTGGEKGHRSQRMMSFRVDNENAEWLEQFSNKGRYINNLIDADRKQHTERC